MDVKGDDYNLNSLRDHSYIIDFAVYLSLIVIIAFGNLAVYFGIICSINLTRYTNLF